MTALEKSSDRETGPTSLSLRDVIRAHKLAPEPEVVSQLLTRYQALNMNRTDIEETAVRLVTQVRDRRSEHSILDVFLQEFGLSNEEGVALMCLAEALLRVPDSATMDALIADKLMSGNWGAHLGHSPSIFVNASTWALMLTGKVVSLEQSLTANPVDWFKGLVNRLGEPVIRQAMLQAMRILGNEFVLGQTIHEALNRCQKDFAENAVFSFDMLGEGARTEASAEKYFDAYRKAIRTIGAADARKGAIEGPGISIKLSALHPRYEVAQRERVLTELGLRLSVLAREAADINMGLTIDAEEADRLDLSLDLFEQLAGNRQLRQWDGLGLAVQAYGKRALPVIKWLYELAGETGGRFTVRLVKGAYWDAEIKRAQEQGHEEFPVFTRKASTDLSYLICANTLMTMRDRIFPQFATHNAHTIAAVMQMAAGDKGFEFQRLHGMGELLYEVAREHYTDFPNVRIYAPIGGHEDLLGYLVRRLLENGANSSFVNRFLDDKILAQDLVRDPAGMIEQAESIRHQKIRLPKDLFGNQRRNSLGLDLTSPTVIQRLERDIESYRNVEFKAHAIVDGEVLRGSVIALCNPANRTHIVGSVAGADPSDVERAAEIAHHAQPKWDALGGERRAALLEHAAELLEKDRGRFLSLLIYEAGKTIPDALAELREAVDFCRYYAVQARRHFAIPQRLDGPTGELNELSLHGRGVFSCISPWNFPLAIFIGQVTAALAAGNGVLAKPAEQAPLIAAEAIKLLHKAGIPKNILHLLPGDGETIGQALVQNPVVSGVAFTGSTETAQKINRVLAARAGPIVPFIAETGGQNVMIVDSTALLEQVVDDVVRSAFLSAGQRCSALRVIYLQEETADKAIEMICGAMDELTIGEPSRLSTDIGPLIDHASRQSLERHIDRMRQEGRILHVARLSSECDQGSFFAPNLVEISSIKQLKREQFGPILHVIRYRASELERIIEEVNSTGYGLTLGVQSRIEERVRRIFEHCRVGNIYVNRNMVGAVVGVQPFGGQGLSGTGPKAGGPHYLFRFATEKTLSINTMASGGNAELLREIV